MTNITEDSSLPPGRALRTMMAEMLLREIHQYADGYGSHSYEKVIDKERPMALAAVDFVLEGMTPWGRELMAHLSPRAHSPHAFEEGPWPEEFNVQHWADLLMNLCAAKAVDYHRRYPDGEVLLADMIYAIGFRRSIE